MSRFVRSPRRGLRPVVAVLVAALALSGCAAGQISQTADQVAAIDGANGTVGYMGVRNVLLATTTGADYAKGANAPLELWVSNTGIQADTLTGITTPAATSVVINGVARIPGQTLKDFTGDTNTITLRGLTSTITYGQSVPVTFSFASAGTLTVNVPIAIPPVRTTGREEVNIEEPDQTSLWQPGEADGSAAPSSSVATSAGG